MWIDAVRVCVIVEVNLRIVTFKLASFAKGVWLWQPGLCAVLQAVLWKPGVKICCAYPRYLFGKTVLRGAFVMGPEETIVRKRPTLSDMPDVADYATKHILLIKTHVGDRDMSFPDWKRVVTCVACLGMLIPNTLNAGTSSSSMGDDVRLGEGGVLQGTIVDAQGRIQVGVPVHVRFNGVTVANAKTNQAGRFAVSGLRTGSHQVTTPTSRQMARLWSKGTAPASAKTAVVVSTPKVVRGQEEVYYDEGPYFDASGALVGGLAVVGAIAGIAAWSDSRSSGPTSP
jgi:hypothetical protein